MQQNTTGVTWSDRLLRRSFNTRRQPLHFLSIRNTSTSKQTFTQLFTITWPTFNTLYEKTLVKSTYTVCYLCYVHFNRLRHYTLWLCTCTRGLPRLLLFCWWHSIGLLPVIGDYSQTLPSLFRAFSSPIFSSNVIAHYAYSLLLNNFFSKTQ